MLCSSGDLVVLEGAVRVKARGGPRGVPPEARQAGPREEVLSSRVRELEDRMAALREHHPPASAQIRRCEGGLHQPGGAAAGS